MIERNYTVDKDNPDSYNIDAYIRNRNTVRVSQPRAMFSLSPNVVIDHILQRSARANRNMTTYAMTPQDYADFIHQEREHEFVDYAHSRQAMIMPRQAGKTRVINESIRGLTHSGIFYDDALAAINIANTI